MDRDGDRSAALPAAVQRFSEAWARGEVADLTTMLTPSYTHTDASGALLGRAGWLAYAEARAGRTTAIGLSDVAIRVLGDVAIVTGVNEITGTGIRRVDDTASLTIRFTAVWVWMDGRWKREAFQATPVGNDGFG